MRAFVLTLGLAALVAVGCQKGQDATPRVGVTVSPEDAARVVRAPVNESRLDRAPIEVSDADAKSASLPGASPEAEWMPHLRRVCTEIKSPDAKEKSERATKNSSEWVGKLDVKVTDFHLYSPVFKKWTLEKVDTRTKLTKVRARGKGWYAFGLAVEVENKSDQVLVGDDIYVWATFKSKAGERHCFADAEANRSWNPFAKKGVGDWVKEKEVSEWPLRPQERKRYTVVRNACLSQMFTEAEPSEIEIEVYARFRPLGGDIVIAGPFKTLKRPGGLLRGLAIAETARVQKITEGKKIKAVTALFAAADHVLVTEGKKSKWVPAGILLRNTPDNPPKTEPLSATTPAIDKTYGSLNLKVTDWNVQSWRKLDGKLKQGHKMLTAKVEISVDTSSVKTQLEAGVKAANDALTEAQTEVATREAAVTTAQTGLEAAAGTDDEGAAKDTLKAAKDAFKTAQKGLKVAEKGVKAADKALAGGVNSFLKTQVKAVDCGSFRVDVGAKVAKPFKGSLGKKECKALVGGETVSGTISFDLSRWDMPFVLTWKGPGGLLEAHVIASQALAKILKD